MKDLSVLKKLFLLCRVVLLSPPLRFFNLLFLVAPLFADDLSSVLSSERNQLLEYKKEQNSEQTSSLENSWINPIRLQYSKTYSSQYSNTIGLKQFVISVDQPIFQMGGIWAAMKYASALGKANEIDIEIQKKELIANAYKLLFNLKKAQLQEKKLELLVANDNLDIQIQKESYDAGLTNRTLYDQALLKRNKDVTSKLETEMTIVSLKNDFSLLSDKPPEAFELPDFRLMKQSDYKSGQLELKRDKLRIEEKKYNYRMIWTKYLPQLSLTGRYVNEDLNPMFAGGNLNQEYYTYGFKVSMPLNINAKNDITNSKIALLESKINFDEQRKKVINSYRLVTKKLEVIDKKIALSQEDAEHYKSMLTTAQEFESLGDKTSYDTEIVANSLQVREIDQSIYAIDAQLELLGLYSKVADAIIEQ
jgi:outer membrane protein TolC